VQDPALIYLSQAGVMRLKSLVLRDCVLVTDYGLAPLLSSPACSELESLDLSGCPNVGEPSIQVLSGLSKLRQLRLAGVTRFGDASIVALCQACPNLALIDLSIDLNVLDTTHRSRIPRFSTLSVSAIGRYCANLRHLQLSGACRVHDESVELLSNCKGTCCAGDLLRAHLGSN
jgi:hypothetical protein